MIKRLIVICITIISSSAFAQQGTASPYSFYGLGTLKFNGTVENQSMGGIGVYMDSIHVNLRNPAFYGGKPLKSKYFAGESRPVRFAIAGRSNTVNLKSNTQEANGGSSTFSYMALAIPVGKFGFGFGLVPYSSVGYRLDDENDDGNLLNRYQGEGGVNRVFAGFGYQLTDKLSLGVDLNYNFGNISNTAIALEFTTEGDIAQLQTREFNRSDISGLNINFGLAYKGKITDKLELSATATYAPGANLVSKNQRTFETVTLTTDIEVFSISNSIEADLDAQNLDVTDLNLPSRLAVGAGIGAPRSWFVGMEYTYMGTGDFRNPIFDNGISTFENSNAIALGGFYIPNYNAFSGYFNRVVYRAGFNYSNTGLIIKDESIKEFGISFGLGLPVGDQLLFSNANVGLELGRRGTRSQNLVQENFINLNLSLSLSSRWFQKRKYN